MDGAAGAFGGSFGSLGQILKHEEGEAEGPNGTQQEVQQPQPRGQNSADAFTAGAHHLGLSQQPHRNGYVAPHASAAYAAGGAALHVNGKLEVR